jgi:hypothetical protein
MKINELLSLIVEGNSLLEVIRNLPTPEIREELSINLTGEVVNDSYGPVQPYGTMRTMVEEEYTIG